MSNWQPFKVLQRHKYASLTIFRRSGEAVLSTPVWFALVDDRVYVSAESHSGKMKRIRNNPRVVLTPRIAWGRPRGESVEGIARIVEGNEPLRQGSQALLRNTGWSWRWPASSAFFDGMDGPTWR